jgi:hypothetical protein
MTTTSTASETLAHLRSHGRAVYLCEEPETLRELAIYCQSIAHESGGQEPIISARGNGAGGIELCGVSVAGESWQVSSPWSMWGKRAAKKCPIDLEQHPASRVVAMAREWSRVVDSVGLSGAKLSAGTAAAQLLPETWLRASRKFAATQPWLDIRSAYYGGRVELYRPGYEGPAVEHDIRSAYGAALAGLLGWMPDCQFYADRRPLRGQPGWLDATVEVSGEFGPLPYRDPDRPWRISWPTSGRWRAWFTSADLESPGVEVVEVHASHAGRFRNPLARPVTELLEARETLDPWGRAVVRQLVVSLAGKMGQRPVRWRVWAPPHAQRPPPGLRVIGDPFGSHVMLYPSEPAVYPPTIIPQVASYVTARTRGALLSALIDAGDAAIYCDTDAVHLPASSPAPFNSGAMPGQWTAKVEGHGHYIARRRYRLGKKLVNWRD